MKLGPVLTYKNADEAEKLIGKRVIASDTLFSAENYEDLYRENKEIRLLSKVFEGNPFPFRISNGEEYQFIREVIDDESHYEPYDLSDSKVRDSLRGRWFRDEDGNEVFVDSFCYNEIMKAWYVVGYSSKNFLENCEWLDGTPCGRMADKEMSFTNTDERR